MDHFAYRTGCTKNVTALRQTAYSLFDATIASTYSTLSMCGTRFYANKQTIILTVRESSGISARIATSSFAGHLTPVTQLSFCRVRSTKVST